MVKSYTTTEHQTNYLRKLANELLRTADVIEGKEISTITEEPKKTSFGRSVAKMAEKMYGGSNRSSRRCLEAVQNILDESGIKTDRVPSAYMFVSAVKDDNLFKDYYFLTQYNSFNFDKAKAGTIIVFNSEPGHPHGHIEIKVFGTAWVSDYKQLKRRFYGSQKVPFMVYVPRS